ncbi:hypothetical protein BU24DRAFT_440896 [Aaosphaeria arxii CBS 175.79]|uniref:Zn(2)-C6 fungal-type domain-containing protein n=1 Tax=Aaosphaeria arxii CBS 175.79 TaxID=1450172 RepID=A0A6A5XZ56_9PLEO|nr:uncharacterized protein BU24DRAFT_440896 [Aaosphaeria arxii CBS 175.79]KAF2018276.1 hypothetical protein BU24DRAFT_440896 [Aaosphaeria arxii CBS 175.79]
MFAYRNFDLIFTYLGHGVDRLIGCRITTHPMGWSWWNRCVGKKDHTVEQAEMRGKIGKSGTKRIRIVEGSCWPCKKRRIKCDLTKPSCSRCSRIGSECNYNSRLIKWSTRPTATAPEIFQAIPRDERLSASLAIYEKRALDYFHGRFWPLLTTSSQPCTPPTFVALEHRVVLLATCVLADSHRVLQDGRNSQRNLYLKRLDCLAAVRGELGCCYAEENGPLMTLLFAVLLLYFLDGYLECTRDFASTSSHHAGVRAIIERLGGITSVMRTSEASMQMLLSEFASTDLTTAMLRGTIPHFPPEFWDSVEQGSVWWGRDLFGRSSLAKVFREMSTMMFWREGTIVGAEEFSIEQIRVFEAALRPVYATLVEDDFQLTGSIPDTQDNDSADVVACYTLTRALQHAALIYLYRAVCNLPITHPQVQQHVLSCLDCIFAIQRPSKILNCVLFPLCIAGAHATSAKYQRTVLDLLNLVYDEMRFASVHSISSALEAIWKSEEDTLSWVNMFAGLSENTLVL